MDNPEILEFDELLKGYLRESLNPKELALFFKLAVKPENSELLAQSFRQELDTGLPDLSSAGQSEAAWAKLYSKMKMKRRSLRHMPVALQRVAILVCLIGATVVVYMFGRSKSSAETVNEQPAVQSPLWLGPDHIGATLILADGDSIALNNDDKGAIADQHGIRIFQSGGAIRYSGDSQIPMYNEIRTAKGKLWRAILPDHTVVWLNSGSSIKYPLQFAANARSVEITGEVYFEVVHRTGHPFQVETGGLLVEDIGTSFNIKTFVDDSALATTLVEGSVHLTFHSQQATVSAGQQSLVSARSSKMRIIQNANLAEALAWKNGFFYFQHATLSDVMKQVSEWYHADVIYKSGAGKELFSGQIDKTLSLSDVLRGLEQPGVKFNLDGNHQITVIQQ